MFRAVVTTTTTQILRTIYEVVDATEYLFARIDPTYDPADDVTIGGYTVPIIASDELETVDGTVYLTDGTDTFGPYTITCANDAPSESDALPDAFPDAFPDAL